MTFSNDLCEIDKDRLNLYGTGELKGFKAEYIDQYFDSKKTVRLIWPYLMKNCFSFYFKDMEAR